MRFSNIAVTPLARMEFIEDDVGALMKCALAHYDPACRHAAEAGGIINGMKNMVTATSTPSIMGRADRIFRFRELDLLAKVLEVSGVEARGDDRFVARCQAITNALHEAMQMLNAFEVGS